MAYLQWNADTIPYFGRFCVPILFSLAQSYYSHLESGLIDLSSYIYWLCIKPNSLALALHLSIHLSMYLCCCCYPSTTLCLCRIITYPCVKVWAFMPWKWTLFDYIVETIIKKTSNIFFTTRINTLSVLFELPIFSVKPIS